MKYKKIVILILFSLITILLNGFTKPNLNDYQSFDFEFENNQNLRAVWVTPVVGEISTYTTEAAFKNEMNGILDMLEYYNINALIFHVRTHNNALYDSDLNPKATWFSNVNYANFDPLMWLIEATQARGIEFHAWLNPYRYGTNYVGSMPLENPASDLNNVLINPNNSALRILNPGLPTVRDFIVDTVIEIIEKYPVDAIHFDDYFYTNLGANGSLSGSPTILDEPDQSTFITYGAGYNTNSATDKANWRREQINLMIESVSNAIKDFNENNNTYVQFGISPTGIYKNGNGVVTYDVDGKPITTGSETGGQTHFSSYLFSDSLYWISEGYLDYIAPQSYWATDHSVASYYKVMGWWDKVVKNLPVNLYSGIGLYMADEATNTFSWKTDAFEFDTQLEYLDTLENTQGFSIYSLRFLTKHYQNVTAMSKEQVENARHRWSNIAVLPILKSMDPVYVDSVSDIAHNNGILSFSAVPNAKQYYIYKSSDEFTYDTSEIIGVIGRTDDLVISFETNDFTDNYQYGVRALSYTNHLSSPSNSNTIEMIAGASIRTANENGQQGLRFYANKPAELSSDAHGFYIVYGHTTKESLNTAITAAGQNEFYINGKKVFKVAVSDVNVDGTYSVVLTGIPEAGYAQNITVFGYYEKNGQVYLSDNATTRSILEVAMRMHHANDAIPESKAIIEASKDTTKHLVVTPFNGYAITGLFETNHHMLKSYFISDWNALFGTNYTDLVALDFFNNAIIGKAVGDETISGSRIYNFFNDEAMRLKWTWLLDYLASIDGTVWTSRQILAVKGDGTLAGYSNLYSGRHLINSIYNFFYEAHEIGGYTAINFITNKHFYHTVVNFSDYFLIQPEVYNFIKVGDVITLPGPVLGYETGFQHFVIQSVVYQQGNPYTVTGNVRIDPIYQ